MSSILKALKRLEDEKTARNPETFHIGTEILRNGNSRTSISLKVVVWGIVMVACGAGITYVLIGGKPTEKSQDSTVAAVRSPITTAEINRPFVIPEKTAVEKDTPASPQPPTRPDVSQSASNMAGNMAPSPPHDRKPSPAPAVVPPPAHTAAPPVPVLKVNGIAYQDNSNESIAVVNGSTVSVGSVIDGIRVVEIRKDRVLFANGNENFDVPLGKSNR